MTRTERSSRASRAGKGSTSALDRAAEALEALTRTYDNCVGELEAAEATVDALLDDPSACVLVVDGDGTVAAVSRGMAPLLEDGTSALGRPVERVIPTTWPVLAEARTLSVSEGWRSVPVADGAGRLRLRRVTEDDRAAVVVVRYEEA